MKVKTLTRSDWSRLLSRRQAYMPLNEYGLQGYAGLILMERVTAPLFVPLLGEDVLIAADGYSWLQIAPEGENWWLTVMFDAEGKCIQYYFDVSLKNEISGPDSQFIDLYLDVVLLPDGRMALLDADELDAALADGSICEEEHALAVRTAEMLLKSIPDRHRQLARFCRRLTDDLSERMTVR